MHTPKLGVALTAPIFTKLAINKLSKLSR